MGTDYIGRTIPANLFRGIEAVGGNIVFKEQSLLFKSHDMNVQTGETEIEYAQIFHVENIPTLGVVPNGLLITARDGTKFKFVVNNRAEIIEFLMGKIPSI